MANRKGKVDSPTGSPKEQSPWSLPTEDTLAQSKAFEGTSRVCPSHLEKEDKFWALVLWSDETKLELFGHRRSAFVWRVPIVSRLTASDMHFCSMITYLFTMQSNFDVESSVVAYSFDPIMWKNE